MTIYETLKKTGLPVVFSHFKSKKVNPPYLVYIGNGQNFLDADNTHFWRNNRYRIEYYFIDKDESKETAIEDALLESGFLYEKSEDIFVESEGVFLIYFYI